MKKDLRDLAKQTISEVELHEAKRKSELELKEENKKKEELRLKEERLRKEQIQRLEEAKKAESVKKEIQLEKPILPKIEDEIQVLESEILNPSITEQVQVSKEDMFLRNLRERILVLFEGLNSVEKDQLEQRLQLTTNFLEFLLANIEDKLKD
ncbi:2-oxoglutarate:acceptor oxidoreductase [Campylobacter sp. LR291e]|uniref:CiaD-like domain-containing protein n=1 Tax=unclassified Campylobacter TaxID=2593542 RepID=UPI00123A38BC|nr:MULTISPECIES: 2-oxoglutarate:acceptor oxidoreductase [unclassified Campylobacter]KAA6229333.1 2-oxoglutarate:acceptor oxidoreductase [Campylobacter sp. LR291e]KAA6231139.1 2-oxoglutarate:acceptor oxidoreductase [Campylobacter sp. LR264d]